MKGLVLSGLIGLDALAFCAQLFVHNAKVQWSWIGNPHLKSPSIPDSNHNHHNVSAPQYYCINCPPPTTNNCTITTIPSMDTFLSKSLLRIIKIQARLFIKQRNIVLDRKSSDFIYRTSDTFLAFLEESHCKVITDLLRTVDESKRVEHILKLLQEQIRYLKKRRDYSMSS